MFFIYYLCCVVRINLAFYMCNIVEIFLYFCILDTYIKPVAAIFLESLVARDSSVSAAPVIIAITVKLVL